MRSAPTLPTLPSFPSLPSLPPLPSLASAGLSAAGSAAWSATGPEVLYPRSTDLERLHSPSSSVALDSARRKFLIGSTLLDTGISSNSSLLLEQQHEQEDQEEQQERYRVPRRVVPRSARREGSREGRRLPFMAHALAHAHAQAHALAYAHAQQHRSSSKAPSHLAAELNSHIQQQQEQKQNNRHAEQQHQRELPSTQELVTAARQPSSGTPIPPGLPPAVNRAFASPTPFVRQIEPSIAWDPSSMSGSGVVIELSQLHTLYALMHTYLAQSGVDGLKVDAQSGLGAFGSGRGGGAALVRLAVSAMEDSARAAFTAQAAQKAAAATAAAGMPATITTATTAEDLHQQQLALPPTRPSYYATRRALIGGLQKGLASVVQHHRQHLQSRRKQTHGTIIGCMCHSTENLYSFKETSLIRASDDFYPREMDSQTVHVASCAFNSVFLGEIGCVDWDMFHSLHPMASMHAAPRGRYRGDRCMYPTALGATMRPCCGAWCCRTDTRYQPCCPVAPRRTAYSAM